MKKILLLIVATLMVAAPQVKAQSKYGPDSANCVVYLSYYKEYMKQKNYEEATPNWYKAFKSCPPSANQTMLIDGQSIMRRLINQNRKDAIRRGELIDTLMMLHQLRIENYPKYRVQAHNNKGLDMINYYGATEKSKLYEGLSGVVVELKENTNPVILVNRMKVANELYQQGTIAAEEVMNVYTENIEIFESIVEASPSNSNYEAMKRDMESLFIESGVASCENLIALYTPRYEENPNDKALVSNIVKMMGRSECMDSELFLKAVTSLHALEPSATSSYSLYKLNSSAGNTDLAIQYLQETIAMEETDASTDADYLLELATYVFKNANDKALAIESAKKAAELKPEIAGRAYFLIGTIWGSVRCGGNEIESRAQYWVAVDYLNKAKNADETLTEEANNLIGQYRAYFPQQAEAFMYDVLDGASYTVACSGLRENTVVRTNK